MIARQAQVNLGKLPMHDLMLHGWISVFGSSLAAMRSMSAAFGVIAILLVYFVSRELFASGHGAGSAAVESRMSEDDIGTIAGLAALIFAVSLVSIKYSREARMYPVMLAAILAQVGMFLRALRDGGLANYIAIAILTAIAIATHFSAVLLPAVEGLWLIFAIARAGWRPANSEVRRGWTVAIALAAGGCALAPQLLSAFHATTGATPGGVIHWIKRPPVYAPVAFFNKATGSFVFPILSALAIWGVVRGWRAGPRDAIAFALLWMWGPPLIMVLVSYALTPIFVERYALSCFVPFFILVAFGAYEIRSDPARIAALAIVVALSAGHIVSYTRKPHDAQYREATAAADAALKPGEVMTVVPPYAIEVLRYYLPADRLDRAVRHERTTSNAAVLINGDQNLAPGEAESFKKEYPQLVVRLRGVTVLRR